MVVTLFPQLHRRDRNPMLYVWVHLVAMTAWALSMREFPSIPPKHRLSYFIGLGLPCWLIALPGTVLGYFIAGWVPSAITLGLVFINPLFFLLTFTEVKPWANRMGVALGCVLGPAFFLWDADSSLLTTGLVGGTLAYAIDRRWLRTPPQEMKL
jgi:predicted branched-subunit amino acid permease